MSDHVKEFFCQASDGAPRGNFHHSIVLHEHPEITLERIHVMIPHFPRGWYELAHLNASDRIEFTRDYWLTKLPYHQEGAKNLKQFFDSLQDIGIYIVQKGYADPYEAHMVYGLKDDGGFFHGCIGASEKQIEQIQKDFSDFILPSDYLAFLSIHNGFSKAADRGILPTNKLKSTYDQLSSSLSDDELITTENGSTVHPKALIPFYESFEMPVYQCFWRDWYPAQEMGNVYYSGTNKVIPDVIEGPIGAETQTFPTFLDWLFFYLEHVG